VRARAVIGANFGDEGKGLVTDYLCSQGAGMVVRFNGGAQAGHTVVTPDGLRHVFQHVGAGAFCGVPTFLSQFFVCNPLVFLKEFDALTALGVEPIVYAHPNCIVTTFADMIINQRKEDARGKARHGSVGVGVHETMTRSKMPELAITMSDLWNGAKITGKLHEICNKYASFRTGTPIARAEEMIGAFEKACETFAGLVHPLGIGQCKDPVFEGAQGLLLDQDNKEFFPHVTHSKTGMHNVRILCAQAGVTEIESYYVTRSYLTRHGAGPLPGEDPKMSFYDDTNTEHSYQGT
jgi:adenylosuccinate synthase